jgi:hypothetical protein
VKAENAITTVTASAALVLRTLIAMLAPIYTSAALRLIQTHHSQRSSVFELRQGSKRTGGKQAIEWRSNR